ncbi:MAG: hypothetical protein HON23_07435 [Rickettsiales bacterium]|nr:hypothetical protein [Rickettsiales bacterium]
MKSFKNAIEFVTKQFESTEARIERNKVKLHNAIKTNDVLSVARYLKKLNTLDSEGLGLRLALPRAGAETIETAFTLSTQKGTHPEIGKLVTDAANAQLDQALAAAQRESDKLGQKINQMSQVFDENEVSEEELAELAKELGVDPRLLEEDELEDELDQQAALEDLELEAEFARLGGEDALAGQPDYQEKLERDIARAEQALEVSEQASHALNSSVEYTEKELEAELDAELAKELDAELEAELAEGDKPKPTWTDRVKQSQNPSQNQGR